MNNKNPSYLIMYTSQNYKASSFYSLCTGGGFVTFDVVIRVQVFIGRMSEISPSMMVFTNPIIDQDFLS